ncbi:MAG: twin-arginine translocation signal domain-containing protein [Anaerolineales bacterium]|nr:twin-arginine translocation signal domain-containing protein [Anaerolineales bacterium]
MPAFTRRDFIKLTAALPAVAAWPAWMPRLAFAPPHTAPRGDVLVCVFLRGAADALNMVVPHGEDIYYQERPTLPSPAPTTAAARPGCGRLIWTAFLASTRL